MADVFISYARSTAESARLMADSLRSSGYSVWFDDEIPAHRAYADVISEKLDEAKAVIVVWSREAAASHWVRSEANRAREKEALVQVNVDASRLPMPFDQIQYIDFRSWRGDPSAACWRKLLSSVAELVRRDSRIGVPAQLARRSGTGVGRRSLVIGGAAAAAAAAGAFLWWPRGGVEPPPEAKVLHQKAMVVMQDARPGELNQAIAYLIEATRMEPRFAAAWGTLAVAYALRKYQAPLSARAGYDARCRSAARSALDLDPSEPLASCALALLVPPYRNWRTVEELGRKLAGRFPDLPLAVHLHADVLADVGRWREAVDIYRNVNRARFFIPLSDRSIILALWSAGDMQGAENMLDQAVQRWPQHFAIWDLRVKFLTHSGRADEAIRLLENGSERPSGYPDDLVRSSLVTARSNWGFNRQRRRHQRKSLATAPQRARPFYQFEPQDYRRPSGCTAVRGAW